MSHATVPRKGARLPEGLHCFEDDCNVYVVKSGTHAIAFDFGSGRWLKALGGLGVSTLDAVFLTHHHVDQCRGLSRFRNPPFQVIAPAAEQPRLDPRGVARHWRTLPPGCPSSYSVLKHGLNVPITYVSEAQDWYWGNRRIRCIPTPGHGPGAHSFFVSLHNKELCFCGDAAHADARIWEPFHLEWSHWLPDGALAAWNGLNRLAAVGMDLLCPSHGPVVGGQPNAMLKRLARRVGQFYDVKLSICAGERDHYVEAEHLGETVHRLSPHLYTFGNNAYLLLSETGNALVVDPHTGALEALEGLLEHLGNPRIEAAFCSHYHSDHADGIPVLRGKYGAAVRLHPKVAAPLRAPRSHALPFLPPRPVVIDGLLPEEGAWDWREYTFRVAHFPGQTWYHAAHMTTVDGRKILFGGDSFQPPSRWNGTGGFCAYNRSHFSAGFGRSARLVLDWRPDLLCNGHGTFYHFHASHFRRIERWARRAENAVRALCPGEDMVRQYYGGLPYGTPSRQNSTVGTCSAPSLASNGVRRSNPNRPA